MCTRHTKIWKEFTHTKNIRLYIKILSKYRYIIPRKKKPFITVGHLRSGYKDSIRGDSFRVDTLYLDQRWSLKFSNKSLTTKSLKPLSLGGPFVQFLPFQGSIVVVGTSKTMCGFNLLVTVFVYGLGAPDKCSVCF